MMAPASACLGFAAGLLALTLQGCFHIKPPPICSTVGANCMPTRCCTKEGFQCYVRDADWAECKESCTKSFNFKCDLLKPDGESIHATTEPPATTPTTTLEPVAPISEDDVEWISGTWTTGYWDCCKPSCSWAGKGNTDNPVASCDAGTGRKLEDPNVKSVCDGGTSVTCADNQPFVIHSNLSMGFAAAAVSGKNGLVGDENCGQCFEILFTEEQHVDEGTGDLWGGSSPRLTGKRMIVQVTNIGYDVTGNHSFDILVPGAGQGIFEDGCKTQYPDKETDDFDCGVRHGGCSHKSGCGNLPEEMRSGCEWHFDWYHWLADGKQTNNPYIKFRRVRCPREITDISGATPDDNDRFPEVVESPTFYYM